MTPEPDAAAAAYRRGRWFTLIVVVGTGLLFFGSSAQGILSDPPKASLQFEVPGHWLSPAASRMLTQCLSLALDAFFVFLLCRFAFRGGLNSTGCLTLIYSLGLVGVGFGLLFLGLGLVHLAALGGSFGLMGFRFQDVGYNPVSTALFLLCAAWTVFAYWVLVRSKDARFYREASLREKWSKTFLE